MPARPHRWVRALVATALVLTPLAPLDGPPAPDAGRITHPPGGDGRVLARPDTDGGVDDAYDLPAAEVATVDTPHFRIHFATRTEDAADPAFARQAGRVFEQVRRVLVDELGWPPPVPDAGLGGDDRVDVYLVDLDDAYGYATADDVALCTGCPVHGYLVLDDDYAGYRPDPASALRSTAAHEYLHLIQFGIAYDAEAWAYEATAVWAEQVVFPGNDARTQYLVDFAAHPELPLPDFGSSSGGFDRSYGAYVWNTWLADRFGPSVVRDAWTASARLDEHVADGYAAALADRGTLLERELVAFLAATAAWDVGGFPGEPLPYPPLVRAGSIGAGDVVTVEVDHLAAHVADLDVDAAEGVRVTVRGPKFVAGGVAVVASGPGGVVQHVDDTLFDGQAEIDLPPTPGADRVTLLVVNADPALAVPKPPGSDEPDYLFADVRYLVGVDADPGRPVKR